MENRVGPICPSMGDNWLPTKHNPKIISPVVAGGEGAKVGDFID